MRYGSLIDGADREAAEWIEVLDPATEEVCGSVGKATLDDCIDAVEAAASALGPWSRTSPRKRAELLRAAFELMRERKQELAETIVRENGKSLADALGEVDYAAEFFRWFSEEAVRIGGDLRLAPNGDKRIMVTKQPIGVSLLITPWNFPAAMAARKLAPALAAGCTTVVKPASETPLTAFAVAQLLADAGFPAGTVNVVCPRPTGPAVHAMMSHPATRAISFTGSTEVGATLLEQAAPRVLRCSMELGGNAPFIVYGDADVDAAVAAALVAKMRNGGASCIAANRFYVHERVREPFVAKLAEGMSALPVGPGLEPGTALGPMVSGRERDRVAELVDGAVTRGARLVCGGAVPNRTGFYFPATVLDDIPADDEILRTEIFGPVAAIVGFGDSDDVLALANDTDDGLAGYVCAGDLAQALRTAEALEVGIVGVNRGFVSDPAAPFGGYKASGLGREGGDEGIEEFLETKYIAVDWA